VRTNTAALLTTLPKAADYLIVGQVRPIADYQLTPTAEHNMKRDLIEDFFPSPVANIVVRPLSLLPTKAIAITWFMRNSIPIQRVANLPHTSTDTRLWLVQTMLNDKGRWTAATAPSLREADVLRPLVLCSEGRPQPES